MTLGSVAMLAIGTTMCSGVAKGNSDSADSIIIEEKIETKKLTLVFAGDLMQHMPQINSARVDGGYDYTECFAHIKSKIDYADVAVGNFETTLAGPPYSGFPQFSAPDDFLKGVKDAGFDVLLCANNHVCDKGKRGVDRTIMMMDSLGIPHLGSYVDEKARKAQYPFLLEKNGFRLVFLNYTYGTNGIPVTKPNIINIINKEQIAKDIKDAKAMKPDCIIAFMHWGEEYRLQPTQSQREMADWLFKQGVDHVIGGHPHVVEPMEVRTDSVTGMKHALAYSLGNFVSNQYQPNTYGGMLVHMELEKDSTTRMSKCDYSLYFVTRPVMSGHKSHRVYDADTPDSELNPGEKRLRDTYLRDVKKVLK